MKSYEYVIVGGGMTSAAAVDGIREIDAKSSILLISSDSVPPYNRPPLSKGLWKGKDPESIWRHAEGKEIDLELETTVTRINPRKKIVETESGQEYGFDKLLLATGGTPRRLPFKAEGMIYYRYFQDYQKLRALTTAHEKFGVVGMGFIGSEITAALAMNKKKVLVFDIGPGIGWNIFPKHMVEFLNDYYREKGVEVYPDLPVEDITKDSSNYKIQLKNGDQYEVEEVVAGIGIKPNVQLAEDAGLKVSNGVEVDKDLQTSEKDIFAAGDIANFYNPLLDKRVRVEHANNANMMGKQAGRNMAGAGEPYDYLPYFYSDLFDLGYEALGQLDSRSRIVEDWQEKYKKGVLYYMADERVRGVLLWNVWDKRDAAREVIGLPAPVDPEMLKGRIK